MSKTEESAYTPQGMTAIVPEKSKKKTWTRKADGVYLHVPSGFYYHRPGGRKNRTWENLLTTSLAIAKERYSKLKYPTEKPAAAPPPDVTMGEVIRLYQGSGYPDKHKQTRTGQTLADEKHHCKILLEFWDHLTVESCGPAACDRYHTWRNERGFQHGTGERQLDRELNTLNNACRWAVRSELIRFNPISERPRYQARGAVHHCREFMPQNADELHELAGKLFKHPHSVVLGFQLLAEAYSGLRTQEILRWGQEGFGELVQGGTFARCWRAKGQHAVNPYVDVHPGLRALLEAHKRWKEANYPESKTFFPSHCGGEVVDEGALAHALRRICRGGKKFTSHGMRAFYVLVRRSQGATDAQIAFEIGHTSGGACITSTYGGVPESWRNGGGPNLQWLPAGEPAWACLKKD